MDITGYQESGYARPWSVTYGRPVIGAMKAMFMDGMPVIGGRMSASMAALTMAMVTEAPDSEEEDGKGALSGIIRPS
jgi:hypothetical protein